MLVNNISIFPPLEPCCLDSCNFDFLLLSCHHHYKGVIIFQKGVSEGKDDWSVGSFLLIHCNSELLNRRFHTIGSDLAFSPRC